MRAGRSGSSTSDIERFVAAELGAAHAANVSHPAPVAPAPVPAVVSESDRKVPALLVLTGPSSGRELVLDKDETVVGRVGVQVAAVRRIDGALRLVTLEGEAAPSVNGKPVPDDGQALKSGDCFEIAGVRIKMIERPAAGVDESDAGTTR
jgi:hypothetical protein